MSEPPPAKRRRIGNTSVKPKPVIIDQSESALLGLSDDVLVIILRLLSSFDLLILSQTCLRLESMCLQTNSLWTKPDFTDHPMELKEMRKYLKLFNARTVSLTFEGFLKTKGQAVNISEAFLSEISRNCPQLQTLKLQNFYFQADKITFDQFPRTLTHLSFSGSEVTHLPTDNQSYFKNIHKIFPNLEILDLENCGWVSNHNLMAICKLEKLKILILKACFNIGECFAYTALATRFGFEKIEKFDLRDTNVSDMDIACFGRKPTLQEILVGGQTENKDKISDRGIDNLCVDSSSNIERLTLDNCDITDRSLITLAENMKRLKYLDVSRCKHITSDGLKIFESKTELRPKPFDFCNIVHEN